MREPAAVSICLPKLPVSKAISVILAELPVSTSVPVELPELFFSTGTSVLRAAAHQHCQLRCIATWKLETIRSWRKLARPSGVAGPGKEAAGDA